MPEMATTYHGGGSQSPTAISKPIERVFEDAQHTGEILLNGRKLREYPKLAAKYDLVDTISADVSKNRMAEVPKELCLYISMEKLNCYHNVIKSIPESLVQLQALTYLNLSRNQLSIIPPFISQLQTLEVLIASHNRLVSLPEEIGVLDKLMELDVSCNEISHLPLQIGDLKSLKSLNVRRNLLQELPVEISKLNLRKLDISSNRISKIPTVFRKIETLEEILLENNPLTLPPAHVCTRGKQHIMKYLQITAIREDKARLGMLSEIDMKRFRKSLPPAVSGSTEEFRTLLDNPDKWKRHTVLSSDSGYSTTDSVDKCGWSPQENGVDLPHIVESNNLAMRAAAAVCREPCYPAPAVTYREPRRPPPEPPMRVNSRLSREGIPETTPPPPPRGLTRVPSTEQTHSYSPEGQSGVSPVMLASNQIPTVIPPQTLPKPLYSNAPTPPTLYPSPQGTTPLTPPTPQGPGPGVGLVSPGVPQGSILGTSLEDEFTRELQRQKQEYESKKKAAELLRIQHEEEEERRTAVQRVQAAEEEEREARRRAAQRIQEEQQALLNKQREVEESKRHEEQRLAAEAEARRAEEQARREEEARHRNENKKPGLSLSNSFKDERRSGEYQYRRTVSDSNTRLPDSSHHMPLTNGPLEEQPSMNGDTPTPTNHSTDSSPNSTIFVPSPGPIPGKTIPNPAQPVVNGPGGDAHKTQPNVQQNTGPGPVSRKPKTSPGTTGVGTTSRVGRLGDKPAGRAPASNPTTSRTGPGARKTNLNQDEELRKSNSSLKSLEGSKPKTESRLRSIQKDGIHSYGNRRSTGSTSSDDDRKRSTPTRTLASSSATSKRSGTGMSNTTRSTTRPANTTPTSSRLANTNTSKSSTAGNMGAKSGASSRIAGSSLPGASRAGIVRRDSTSSTTSVSSTKSKSSVDKTKRSGTVMTSAHVKMLDDYSKEAGGNHTLRRQHEQHQDLQHQLELLRKTISTRLKRSLPENLSEALSDGVLLCHLANQIRPRSVASVHVPSPAVPKLTPPKCRKNVENFLEACRKIGVPKACMCETDDIVSGCRPARLVPLVLELTLHPVLTDVYISHLCILVLVATCLFLYWHGEW
ncbi:DISP complex protein LRCH3-like isoform X6 [Mya arenaria]|uniref:DISP complex protein LRCH3-like isoform X6 n=1 Tax=Mya arenaria TaxID=6604 RepID=UPI0022E3380B|nr:DISP complex protein LRCH3-like isoform X6 [Mya arenaria]